MQRTYNVRTKPGTGLGALHLLNKVLGKHAAHDIKAYDHDDSEGYRMTVHFQHPGVPFHTADDHAMAHDAVGWFNRDIVRKREAAGITGDHPQFNSIHDLPTHKKEYLIPGIPATKGGQKNPDARIAWPNSAARKTVRDVQSAMTRLAPVHKTLAHMAGSYGGTPVVHSALPEKVGTSPEMGVMAHVHGGSRLGVHAATFHFKSKADAWRAMTAIKADGPKVVDVAAHDSKGNEVLNLLKKPSAKAFESVEESAKGGAFRDRAGRFSAVSKPGGGEWVPEIPADFRAVAEALGGKVKRSGNGGGVAVVFKTVEAAKAAHAKLAEQGHRVNPHDIPGVLLVSFVNRRFTGIHEARLPNRIDGNPNQKDALDYARALGASVEDVHRTGEVRVHHPEWDSGVTINSRRKDTPRELIKRLNQLIKNRRQNESVDEDLDAFHMVSGDMDEAEKAAQAMADRIGKDIAVVACEDDEGEGDDKAPDDYMVVPLEEWEDPEEDDPAYYTLVAVFSPSSLSATEAVAKRHSLAARLSAGRIRGRPMGGRRLRVAMRAKAWRRANPGKTKRKRMHTVYRDSSSIHPLKKHL
jgi:hypothetical protein